MCIYYPTMAVSQDSLHSRDQEGTEGGFRVPSGILYNLYHDKILKWYSQPRGFVHSLEGIIVSRNYL